MAVYTHLDKLGLDALIDAYAIGAAEALTGIPEGIENTNYALTTEQGRYILTVF